MSSPAQRRLARAGVTVSPNLYRTDEPGYLRALDAAGDLTAPAAGLIRLMPYAGRGRARQAVVCELLSMPDAAGYPAADLKDRTGRAQLPGHVGGPALTLPLEIEVSGAHGVTAAATLDRLDELAGLDGRDPVPLEVHARGVRHLDPSEPRRPWRLTGDPEWGDHLLVDPAGTTLLERDVTWTIVAMDPDDVDEDVPAVAQGDPYRVRKGGPNTLKAIAEDVGSTWPRLALANPTITAPTRRLPTGTRVRVA